MDFNLEKLSLATLLIILKSNSVEIFCIEANLEIRFSLFKTQAGKFSTQVERPKFSV